MCCEHMTYVRVSLVDLLVRVPDSDSDQRISFSVQVGCRTVRAVSQTLRAVSQTLRAVSQTLRAVSQTLRAESDFAG
jgi:hypothetical protein